MKDYFIEVFNPPFPNRMAKVRVFTKYVRDALSPSLIALYRVKARNKEEALAMALLGKAVTLMSPGDRNLICV